MEDDLVAWEKVLRLETRGVELHGKQTVKMGGARADYQISPSMRLMKRSCW